MKRIFLIVISLFMCAAIIGCSNTSEEVKDTGIADENQPIAQGSDENKDEAVNKVYFPTDSITYNNIHATISSEYTPDNFEDLYELAHSVVIGTVTKSDESITKEDSGLVISLADVLVSEVYKGPVNVGDTVSIEETGERTDTVDVSIGGVPLLRKDMKVLLFLTEPSNVIQGDKDGYGIIGCYYGKMILNEQDTVHPASYFSSNAEIISDFSTPTSVNNVISKLNEFK